MRIREIGEEDLSVVTALFGKAFPQRRPTYWWRGFENARRLPAISGHTRYGYLFEDDGKVRAVLLALSTQIGGCSPRVNLSSWCAHPSYRIVAGLLHAKLMHQAAGSYVNLSPAEHVIPRLRALGFKPYTGGVCLLDARVALRPNHGWQLTPYHRSTNTGLPGALATIAERHCLYGCTVLMLHTESTFAELFIYRRKWIKGILPCAQMIYGQPERVFEAAGPLMRHLLKMGIALALVDVIGHYNMIGAQIYPGRSLRYAYGAAPPVGDMLDTEFALFGP